MENFTPIKGFEGLYSINESGQIFSVFSNRVLKNKPNEYQAITLCKNKIKSDFYIHRLVADHFIPNPDNKQTVNHKDGNKHNNHVSNLEWSTYSENIKHAYVNNLNPGSSPMTGRFGALHHNSKITQQFSLDGVLVKEWSSTREASRNGYTQKYVSYAAMGKIKEYAGFIWKYKNAK